MAFSNNRKIRVRMMIVGSLLLSILQASQPEPVRASERLPRIYQRDVGAVLNPVDGRSGMIGRVSEIGEGRAGGASSEISRSVNGLMTPAFAAVGPGVYDDSNVNWTYTGAWTRGAVSTAFGGTLLWSRDAGAIASIQISGTGFRFRYTKSTNRAIHAVYVDGVKVADLNAYSATVAWQSVYEKTGLTAGVHTVEIRHGGPAGSYIDVDAIEVLSPPSPLGTGLYDERHANWRYTGIWSKGSIPSAFSGTLMWSSDPRAIASVQISGTAFRLRYTKSNNRAIHAIYVDGLKVADVNANSPTVAWQSVYEKTGLTAGLHTIEVRHGGPTGSFIDVDAIEVFSPSAPAPLGAGVYDDSHANWVLTGAWVQNQGTSGPFNNSFTLTSDTSARASFQISGSAFRFRYTRAANRGVITVYIDGVKDVDLNASSTALAWQAVYTRTGLTTGNHTIELRHGGGAAGSHIDFDALEAFSPPVPLGIGLYDDRHSNWIYNGSWTKGAAASAFGGTLSWSSDKGAVAAIQISGAAFRLRYTKSTNRAIHAVYVDGLKVGDFNAYSATVAWHAVFEKTGLSAGVHTIEIRHGGGPAGSFIDVDALEVFSDFGEKVYLATLRPEGIAMSSGSGYATIRLSADEQNAVVRVSYSNLSTPETSAHIHGPADPGQSGQILFDLDTATREQDGSMNWAIAQIGATSGAQIITALKTGRLYLNIHSARYPAGEIRGHFNRIEGSLTFVPPGPPPGPPGGWTLPTGTPTARDAARLLTQATFGPRAADITTVQQRGLAQWVNDQLALPVSTGTHLAYLDTATAGKTNIYQQEVMESFWKKAVTAPDQLRQRMVFALSQLFVVSFRSNLENEPFAIAGYLDMLNQNAFGNFRQLLENVALSPAMGRYLDHLQNDKEDSQTGRNPNENFAREVLQLFSIGLYRLHPDGSLKLDTSGLPIPTYSQETVSGFAHVFTGWSYGTFTRTEQNWYWPSVWRNGTAFWRVPMQNWSNHHSLLEKRLLDGVVIPAGQTPERDLQLALDNIFNHPNVGPFIARQLIQRLVTSHPSPGYVYRVAQKFNDNGQGVRGDLKAVIRAILLDYEARSLDLLANQGYGKLREPVLRFSHLLRAFNYTCPCGTYPIYWMDSPEWAIGQNPLRSPTVFNFFEPGYSPPGKLAAAGLNSPEFQITTETSVIGISDFFHYVVREGFKWETGKPLTPDYTAVAALAGTPAQLIDHLDLVLTAGGMSSALKTKLVTEIGRLRSNDPVNRATMAIHLILTSPDYVVQK